MGNSDLGHDMPVIVIHCTESCNSFLSYERKKWKERRECRKEGKKTKRREEEASIMSNVLFLGKAGTRL